MSAATHNRRGRPATASPDDVLRAATAQYLAGRRLDLTELAQGLGMSRATIYRWFGSRESLLGEVLARQFELLVAHRRAAVREHGALGLLEVFDRINRDLSRSKPLRRLLEQEPSGGMRLLTSTGGIVQPRAVACVEQLIAEEVRAGTYDPPADPERSPTRSSGLPRRSSTTTPPPGSVAITGGCGTSRLPCSACRGRSGDGGRGRSAS